MNRKILWTHNFPKGPGKGGGWMYNQYDFLKDDVELFYMDGLRSPIGFIKHLVSLILISRKYEVVHAQYGSAVGFITSFAPGRKILSLKGSDWYTSPPRNFFHRIRILLGNILTSYSIKRFDEIIVMSHAMKSEVLKKFPNTLVHVIVDPIDLNKFDEQTPQSRIRPKKVLFAAVNVKNPVKRFALAEKSFLLLKETMPNVEFIKMTGISHESVCSFMNGMDVLLITSVYEGWPNVVKEMLALNKPFVGTDISDLKIIADNTKSCFVCEPEPIKIAEALKKSLESPKEDLRKFVQEFDMNRFLERVKNIYQNQ